MNQGGGTNLLENHQTVKSTEAQPSSYYSQPAAPQSVPWTLHTPNNYSSENNTYSTTTYHPDQSNPNPIASNPTQEYNHNVHSSYTTTTDSYGYSNNNNATNYSNYYNGYHQQQQQSNNNNQQAAYPQPVGPSYQSTGAPISSFANSGSYAGPTSYSTTTYYNPADYQTTASGGGGGGGGVNYQTGGGYIDQSNAWQPQYPSYNNNNNSQSHQYSSYAQEPSVAYSSNNNAAAAATTNSHQYQQHYNQWNDYYNQTEVSCAPGTENTSVTTASNPVCPVPGGYPAANAQLPPPPPPPPYIPTWPPESSSSEVPPVQPNTVTSSVQNNYWNHGAIPSYQSYHVPPQPNYQDPNPNFANFQEQHKPEYPPQQPQNLQYPPPPPPTYQIPQNNYHSSLPSAPQSVVPLESQGINPRIPSNLTFGLPKTENGNNSTGGSATKPAYIGVSMPKSNDNVSSQAAADSMLKPGMFPKSVRGYVERVLARCKDDTQMAASQAVMKDVITKATADGTLYIRDWDTEPLFPMPQGNMLSNTVSQGSSPISSLSKNRSPSRRSKSRWEPLLEVKPVEKPAFVIPNPLKHSPWVNNNNNYNYKAREKQFSAGKSENKEDTLGNSKFVVSDLKSSNRITPRPTKRQRFGATQTQDNGYESSDSDKEQSLTKYYSSAIAISESPDEIKKRESRSKRFEKGKGNNNRGALNNNNNQFKQRNGGTGNLYTRRASALVLSKTLDDGGKRAVEDIDWDALTVKGTCTEIEKRYLRLTSAPDPATVRPEEVLEKALLMVQISPKNYLYKCDQLKSIRQDLTVQRIRDELTAKVYETHARLAIEVGDLSEYNQCQSQLTSLYGDGIKGCHMEFAAYNLLCVILHSSNNRDLLSAMSRLSVESRKDEAVKHALAVRAAVTSGNYVIFFRLYKTGPNLNTCLMDLYVEKMRYAAVKCMSRSYRPTIPVSYIAQVLGFGTQDSVTDDKDGLEECVEWMKAHGASLTPDNNNLGEIMLDTKASTLTLYMPEPDDAVSHGDASLAVNDFLTRTKTESA
jgi:hypothetical protein